MDTLSILLVIREGIHRWLVHSPHKWSVMQSFGGFFVVCLNKLLNKRLAGVLTHRDTHVTSLQCVLLSVKCSMIQACTGDALAMGIRHGGSYWCYYPSTLSWSKVTEIDWEVFGWIYCTRMREYHLVTPVMTWWRHEMETFSALLAICAGNSPVTGEFHTQRPVKRGFDVSFDLRLIKRLSKQWWGWWFKTSSRPLWRHCNEHQVTRLIVLCMGSCREIHCIYLCHLFIYAPNGIHDDFSLMLYVGYPIWCVIFEYNAKCQSCDIGYLN